MWSCVHGELEAKRRSDGEWALGLGAPANGLARTMWFRCCAGVRRGRGEPAQQDTQSLGKAPHVDNESNHIIADSLSVTGVAAVGPC